jgi:DNA polymerase III sliding clamp (beta) subunit (PCNA family)
MELDKELEELKNKRSEIDKQITTLQAEKKKLEKELEDKQKSEEQTKEDEKYNFHFSVPLSILQDLLSATEMLTELILKLTSDGISLFELDNNQVRAVSVEIPKERFIDYDVKQEVRLRFDRTEFEKIKLFEVDGAVRDIAIEVKSTKGKTINKEDVRGLVFSEALACGTKEIGITLNDVDSHEGNKPKIDFTMEATIDADRFRNIISDAAYFSSHVTITSEDVEKIVFKTKGDAETYSYTATLSLLGLEEVKLTAPATATYPLQMLKGMLFGIKKIYLRTNNPIKLEGEKDGMKIEYWCAPRIESM